MRKRLPDNRSRPTLAGRQTLRLARRAVREYAPRDCPEFTAAVDVLAELDTPAHLVAAVKAYQVGAGDLASRALLTLIVTDDWGELHA